MQANKINNIREKKVEFFFLIMEMKNIIFGAVQFVLCRAISFSTICFYFYFSYFS
jgi:hypothetical protein